MNIKTLRKVLNDRILQVLGAGILAAVIFTIITFLNIGSIRSTNQDLNAQLALLHSEGAHILDLKEAVAFKEKKTAARSAGIVPTLEKVLKGLGLKAASIKPLGKKKTDGFTEESAELEIENADLNRLVNFLYMLDTSAALIKIKDISIGTTFEDPDKFILKLTAARLHQ